MSSSAQFSVPVAVLSNLKLKTMNNIARCIPRTLVFGTLGNNMATKAASGGSVEQAIVTAINNNLHPVHLEVVNESYMHNVPKGSETHFKVLVVSDKFDELPLIKRHRLVNNLLKSTLCDQFPHALSIEAKTPKQWTPSYNIEPSPNCLGGFGK